MKKGFAKAIGKFDGYQLAKYKAENKALKLIDVVNLVHPKPTAKNGVINVTKKDYLQALSPKQKEKLKLSEKDLKDNFDINSIEALILGLLKNENTWESKLSEAGQKAKKLAKESNQTDEKIIQDITDELKGESWKELILSKKIGYFALLRNLRNILQQAPDMVQPACELLVDVKLIEKSRVLPFRFITAMTEIGMLVNDSKIDQANLKRVIMAINQGVDLSLQNVPKFDGKTLIALDVSGSMTSTAINSKHPSQKSTSVVSCAEIGGLFAAILAKNNMNADLMTFDSDARYISINPLDSTLTIQKGLNFRGGGTDFNCIFRSANKAYDRVIILSDMQGWIDGGTPYHNEFKAYKKRSGSNPYLYSFDLCGYGSSMFPENKVCTIAGYSDKAFDLIKTTEQDKNALINEIEMIQLSNL
jgi:60 kDa SS-A/Ro ribonucleoprotein